MYCLHEIIWDYVRCSVFQYILPRDIGGSDPERMAAPRVEEYVTQCFAGTKVEIQSSKHVSMLSSKVSVEVQKGQEFFEREYPCLAAVNRAASTVTN